MLWWLRFLTRSATRRIRKTYNPEKTQEKRLHEAYTRGRRRRGSKKERDREQESRLLGIRRPGHEKKRKK